MPPLLTASPKRIRPRRSGLLLAGIATILALLTHVAFVGVLMFLSLIDFRGSPYRPQSHKPSSVSLRPLSPQQWAKNRAPRLSPEKEQESAVAQQQEVPPKPPEQKKETMPKGQVVEVAPGNGQEAPDAKYLAEKSNRVAKQTKAKEQTAFYRNPMPRRTSNVPQDAKGKDGADRLQISGNNGLGNDDRPVRETKSGKSAFELPNIKRRQEVAIRESESAIGPGMPIRNQSESMEVLGNSNRMLIQRSQPGGGEEDPSSGKHGLPGIADLTPSFSTLDKIAGAAPNDHLADVEEGDGTFLNTKEWKYSTFFNRVKQAVGMHWDPGSQLRLRDPTFTIYGGKDRYTLLDITLDSRGAVKNIYVQKSCGIDFLDAEAIASFERSQPFPNPPPGLLASDSTVRFQFGFFLEMGGGPRLRLFRQSN